MKSLYAFIFLVFSASFLTAQVASDSVVAKPRNPIVFIEGFGGMGALNTFGFSGGATLNYQRKANLFTFRYAYSSGIRGRIESFLGIPLPNFREATTDNEYALMYGRRWIVKQHSWSASIGISANDYRLRLQRYDYSNQNQTVPYIEGFNQSYFGIPFELNVKIFKDKRRKLLISQAVVPRVGFKIYGNISQNSYAGAGVSLGFGLHKQY